MKRALLLPLFVSHLIAGAQAPGPPDPSFNPTDIGYGAGDGPVMPALYAVAIQADGGILIGGGFDRFNNVQRNNLVRLMPDGQVDPAFAPTSLGQVHDLAVQPDGKILVGSGQLYRLLPNGTHDPALNSTVSGEVRRVQVQPDGRILAVLDQAPFNPDMVRLLPNGDPDPSFSFAFSGYPITAMALLPSGQIMAAVDYNGTGSKLLRFNSDGSQDNAFNCCPGPDGSGVFNVLPQPDGRMLVAGGFNTYNGVARPRLVRLESNGSVDLSFDAGSFSGGSVFSSLALRPDGRIVCGGSFGTVQGQARPGLVQLLPNGAVDPAFTVGAGFVGTNGTASGPTAMVLDATGRAVCIGGFAVYDGAVRTRLARVQTDGTLDPAFHQQTGVLGNVEDILVRSDGRILLAGNFSAVNGKLRRSLARLMPDGTLDPTFVVDDTGAPWPQYRVKEQSTGKVVVMGQVNGTATYITARIDVDGSLDPGFSIGSGFNGAVTDIAVQPDDRIIAAGSFTGFAGNAVGRIVRLLPDGQFDLSFNTGSGFSGTVNCVLVQPDGRVLVGGAFLQFNGGSALRLIRLNSDGTRDNSFTPAVLNDVRRLALRADGRILVVHSNLGDPNRLSCLLPTGALDPTFNNTFSVGGSSIGEVIVLGNGGILVTGNFATIDGVPSSGIGVLTANGQLDPGFTPGQGLTNASSGLPAVGLCAAVQPDGRILVGGQFTAYGGTGRNRVARVFGMTGTPSLRVAPRVMLGGPFVSGVGLMSDQLRTGWLVPFLEPYSALGFAHVGGGGEQVTSPVLAVTGPQAIVDWVVVELRSAGDPTTVLATRSALVQRDGDVVDVDGASAVPFLLPPGNYHVSIRHRNHLGAMSASPITLSATPVTVDLTSAGTPTWGVDARRNVNGTQVLWPGDATGNGQVKYAGAANDRDAVLIAVGGGTPTNTVNNVYDRRDVNLDGSIKYTGSNNDRDLVLQTIGGTVPTATRTQQLP